MSDGVCHAWCASMAVFHAFVVLIYSYFKRHLSQGKAALLELRDIFWNAKAIDKETLSVVQFLRQGWNRPITLCHTQFLNCCPANGRALNNMAAAMEVTGLNIISDREKFDQSVIAFFGHFGLENNPCKSPLFQIYNRPIGMIDVSGGSELEFNQANRVSSCKSKTNRNKKQKTKKKPIVQLQNKIRSLLDIG